MPIGKPVTYHNKIIASQTRLIIIQYGVINLSALPIVIGLLLLEL